jgi:hypothetical protein
MPFILKYLMRTQRPYRLAGLRPLQWAHTSVAGHLLYFNTQRPKVPARYLVGCKYLVVGTLEAPEINDRRTCQVPLVLNELPDKYLIYRQLSKGQIILAGVYLAPATATCLMPGARGCLCSTLNTGTFWVPGVCRCLNGTWSKC